MDTIFALASARGKAGVSVIRVSGPQAREAVATLCTLPDVSHRAVVRALRIGDDLLDRALVIAFDAPASFTGEDVVELHVHGSPAIVAALLHALGEVPGLRIAEAGDSWTGAAW